MIRIKTIFLGCLLIALAACDSTQYDQGKMLYERFCSNCHATDGSGLEKLIPPLAGSDYLQKNQESLACIVRNGLTDSIHVNKVFYAQPMPGVPQLSDFEITNIVNYINQAWGNDYGFMKIEKVRRSLQNCNKKAY